jgi:hypothetical protein
MMAAYCYGAQRVLQSHRLQTVKFSVLGLTENLTVQSIGCLTENCLGKNRFG